MNWTRVTNTKPYVKTEDWDDETYSLARRLYSPKGKKYPLFCISIHSNPEHSVRKEPLTGIKISFSSKEKSGDWWEDYMAYLPYELFSELEEMLVEVKSKFQ